MIGRALLVACLAAPLVARAEGAEDLPRAQAHYEIGLGLYNLGNYRDAIKEFSAGYLLAPRPEFLVNLGQAHRRLGELDQARAMFRRYLAETAVGAPNRTQVEELLQQIDRQKVAPPTPLRPPLPAPAIHPGVPPGAAATAHRPVRWYRWLVPIGAAVVAAVGAIAIYFAVRPAPQVPCARADITCLDLRG